jgi:hypothetical protein
MVDSLMFLAIASIVSVGLFASFSVPAAQEHDWTDLVSEAHRVLLRCDIGLEIDGSSLPRTDISTLGIIYASSKDVMFGERLAASANEVLGDLIPSSLSYQWVLRSGKTIFLSCGGDSSGSATLYSSAIVLSSSAGVESCLVLWTSLRGQDPS